MSAKIIAYSGAHGTGKTTAVYELASNLKKRGMNVGIILETARKCPIPVFSNVCAMPSVEAQQWIFTRQIQEEIEASSYYDVVVTDRTVVDCIAYTRYFGYIEMAEAMEYMARQFRYDEIHFKTVFINNFLVDDGFRNIDDTGARYAIEKIMADLYKRMNIPYILE